MTSIRENFPGFFTSMNQIYNARQSIRREEMEGRTPLQHCLYMATKLNYVVWTDLDNEGGLSRLLVANLTSIQMIRTWPYVVLIDTTYKTNKQKWPLCEVIGITPTNHNFLVAFCLMREEAAVSYSWVLQGLRDILGTALRLLASSSLIEMRVYLHLFVMSSQVKKVLLINYCRSLY